MTNQSLIPPSMTEKPMTLLGLFTESGSRGSLTGVCVLPAWVMVSLNCVGGTPPPFYYSSSVYIF